MHALALKESPRLPHKFEATHCPSPCDSQVGIVGAVTAGLATFPLCFSLDTALVFNDMFVTTDVADDKDLETW